MAAHIVTALLEWQKKSYIKEEDFTFFLDYAPCADDLEYAHWSNMHSPKSSTFLSNYVNLILPQYLEEWRALGFPETREEWIKTRLDIDDPQGA